MKVKVLSDFCHNIGTQLSLDKHCKKYPTLQGDKGFGLADVATQSTKLVQNKYNYNLSNTSRSCCSCLGNCL